MTSYPRFSRTLRSAARVALALSPLSCLPATAVAASLGGSAALTTDYVWRGTSQSQGDPAVQAGIRLAGESGWYGAVWGSSVEFAPETHASSELDFTVGWSVDVADDWTLDVNLTRYAYPATTIDLDWNELIGTATWRDNYWLQAAWSDDALATGSSGTYAQIGARLPLGEQVRVEAAVGRYWLEDAYGDDYAHAQLGAVWAFRAPFELRVTAHDTDAAAGRLFPGLAGSRVEAALQASF